VRLKTTLLLIVLSSCISLSLFAQGREIVALNQYRGPLDKEKLEVHTYNKIVTYAPDKVKIDKVYTLDNQLRSTTRESYNPDLGYIEAVTQNFDSLSNHTSTRFKNVENDMWMEVFFENGEEVSRLQYSGNKMYRFDIVGRETPIISTTNPLNPSFIPDRKHFLNFFDSRYVHSKQRESGFVLVGIHTDEKGDVTKIECLNYGEAPNYMAKEVLDVFNAYDFKFEPALDIKGNPKASVLRYPIRINYR
tara:strand:+ start:8393 stop:9136 length:744 start_codon:yes stop_codon:yes gene_type:complete